MAETNHGSIEYLKFPNPTYPGDQSRMIKKWLRDSWARRKIAALQTALANIAVPSGSDADPYMDGNASPGTSTRFARADHVHPSDSSKQDVLTVAQIRAINSGITAAIVADYESRISALEAKVAALEGGTTT